MSHAVYYLGDTRDVTATLPDGSVDLVLTSPPFLALRSYLPADHPDKGREIGSEANPAAFLDVLLQLTAEWSRVLAPHGSIAIELGDTYSGSGGAGGDYADGGWRDGQPRFKARHDGGQSGYKEGQENSKYNLDVRPITGGGGWPQAKSLCLIPELYRVALSYGINPLTGQPSPAGKWRVRNVVRWHRPNPPVGALGDKFRPATTDMVIATRAKDRYFDLDAVRTEAQVQMGREVEGNNVKGSDSDSFRFAKRVDSNPAGAPPLDTWVIPTHPYKGAHYATWPPDLCVRPIKAMVPMRVCRVCGEPSRRLVGDAEYVNARSGEVVDKAEWLDGELQRQGAIGRDNGALRSAPTLGWTECPCAQWRNGIVLDPFAGSGTTLAVATGLGRDAIGIDIATRNADLARERVGMFLEVVDTREDVA